jgi:hypothetical protein
MDSEPLEDDSKLFLRNVGEYHTQLRSRDLYKSGTLFCDSVLL